MNGVAQTYTITVQDNGGPNNGSHIFAIATASYYAAGLVKRGDVELHTN